MAKPITNPDKVEFKAPLFYNLANVRKEALKLAARTNGNKDQFEAVMETLDTVAKFAKARYAADKADKDHARKAAEADAIAKKEAEVAAQEARLTRDVAKGRSIASAAIAGLRALKGGE